MSSKVTYSTLTKIVQEVEMATWDRYRTISDISDKTVKEIITKGSSNALTYGIPSLGIAAGIGGALAAGGVAFAGGTIAEGGAAIGGVAAGHALKGGWSCLRDGSTGSSTGSSPFSSCCTTAKKSSHCSSIS